MNPRRTITLEIAIINKGALFSFFNKYEKNTKLENKNKIETEKLLAKVRSLYLDARKDVIKPESNDDDENPAIDLNIL